MRFLIDGRTDRDVNDFATIHLNVGNVLHSISIIAGEVFT